MPGDFVLVLDDYHELDSRRTMRLSPFWLDHLPPQMHLVVATREDPRLPLARLRARGQLTEVRAADLRFTPAEAAEFLKRTMGLDLSAEDVAALETRTEGWIAGLQMAAISLQGRWRRRRRFHPLLHRQPPLRAGLPARGGPAATSRPRSRHSCSAPPSSTACAAPCATRSCVPRPAPAIRPCRPSIAPTCSSSRSTTSGAGTATTTSSATCCASSLGQSLSPEEIAALHVSQRMVRAERPAAGCLPPRNGGR